VDHREGVWALLHRVRLDRVRGRANPPARRRLSKPARKLLKRLRVTAQHEVGIAVRERLEAGELRGDERLEATAAVAVRGLRHDVVVTGTIALS
jgi:hypothetical protein